MHVEICDVPCVLVKTLKTQKQIKYKKKRNPKYFQLFIAMSYRMEYSCIYKWFLMAFKSWKHIAHWKK